MANNAQPGSPYGGGEPASTGDYFSDTAGAKPEEGEAPKEGQEQDEGGETAVLPKSVLGGKEFKPGEEVVLKVVRVHDDNVEVTYSHGESEEGAEGEEQMGKAPMPAGQAGGGDAEMASMME